MLEIIDKFESNEPLLKLKPITQDKKPKDYSIFLDENYDGNVSQFFIDKRQMRTIFSDTSIGEEWKISEILEIRKKLIQKAEKEFTEKLGFNYSSLSVLYLNE